MHSHATRADPMIAWEKPSKRTWVRQCSTSPSLSNVIPTSASPTSRDFGRVASDFGRVTSLRINEDPTKVVIEKVLQSKIPYESIRSHSGDLAEPTQVPPRLKRKGTQLSMRCSVEDLDLIQVQPNPRCIDRIRCFLMKVILSQQFEMFAGCAILCNFIVISMETNARVRQEEADKNSNLYKDATHELYIYNYVNHAFLAFYTIECATRLFIHGRTFFKHKWNVFDLIVVCFGLFGTIMETVLSHAGGINVEHFQILRSIRMFRLLRAARIVISFKELYSLICGLSSCLKTLFWAAGLVFLLLTMWSILCVEYMHPLIRNLTEEGYYSDCSHCHHGFKDIMSANLTLFGIVSGGDWVELWRPVIERHPWTAVIIVCIIFTMVFGMLNLITAVIVDTAARAREADVMHMAKHKEFERQEAWAYFANLCLILDENHDGEISLQELQKGIREIPELSAQLSVLGVDDDDLQLVFDVLDSNQDGKITHTEFIRQLYKIQTYELKSAHCFMKHYVEDIRKHVKLLYARSESDAQLQCISSKSLLARSGSQSDQDLPLPPPQTEPVPCEDEQKGDKLVGEKLKVQSNSEDLPILLGMTKHLVKSFGKSSCAAEEPFGPAGSFPSLQTSAGNSSLSSLESSLESGSVNLVNAFACSTTEPCANIKQRSAETHSEQERKLSRQDLEAAEDLCKMQNDQERSPQSNFIEPYERSLFP